MTNTSESNGCMKSRVQTLRAIDSRNVPKYEHDIEYCLNRDAEIHPGVHTIWDNGMPIDFQFEKASSDTLLVFFHGAVLKKVTLPWFVGKHTAQGINVSTLRISDPSLYLDDEVTLGWYVGNRYQPDLQDTLRQLIAKIAESAGARKLVFYGGSGGGFCSLLFAHFFPGSTSIASNPQTSLASYYEGPVKRYLNRCWGMEAIESLPQSVTTDLTKLYRGSGCNRLLYLQNADDRHHIIRHMRPFLEGVAAGEVWTLMGEWGAGHKPPPKELVHQVVGEVCTKPCEAPELGFKRFAH